MKYTAMTTIIFNIMFWGVFCVCLSASPISQQMNLLDGLHLPSVGNVVGTLDVHPTENTELQSQSAPEAPHHLGLVESLPGTLDHELDLIVGSKCDSGLHSAVPMPVDTNLPIKDLSENKIITY